LYKRLGKDTTKYIFLQVIQWMLVLDVLYPQFSGATGELKYLAANHIYIQVPDEISNTYACKGASLWPDGGRLSREFSRS